MTLSVPFPLAYVSHFNVNVAKINGFGSIWMSTLFLSTIWTCFFFDYLHFTFSGIFVNPRSLALKMIEIVVFGDFDLKWKLKDDIFIIKIIIHAQSELNTSWEHFLWVYVQRECSFFFIVVRIFYTSSVSFQLNAILIRLSDCKETSTFKSARFFSFAQHPLRSFVRSFVQSLMCLCVFKSLVRH